MWLLSKYLPSKLRNFKVKSLWRKASNMDHRTMSYRKAEIKRPCLKDIIFLPNLLAQNTQTAKVILTGMPVEWKRKKLSRTITTLSKNFGIVASLLFLELHSNYFAEQMYLVKKTDTPEIFCSWTRHHLNCKDLSDKHQRKRGFWVS